MGFEDRVNCWYQFVYRLDFCKVFLKIWVMFWHREGFIGLIGHLVSEWPMWRVISNPSIMLLWFTCFEQIRTRRAENQAPLERQTRMVLLFLCCCCFMILDEAVLVNLSQTKWTGLCQNANEEAWTTALMTAQFLHKKKRSLYRWV